MSLIESIILGIVQGLTEFLPVSSSGHLVLLQRIFGITNNNLFFTVMLHVGSLIAVLLVFYKDIWELIKHPFGKDAINVIIATAVTGVMYVFLSDIIDSSYGGEYLAYGFLYTALLLYIVSQKRKTSKDLNPVKSAVVGFMQGIAMFPGVSRSGSTIAGGLLCNVNKEKVARYSFILSIPAILGGFVTEIGSVDFSSIPWITVIVGMICAAVSGIFAIHFMLSIIRKQKLSIFSIYLVILGGLILLDQYFFHIVF